MPTSAELNRFAEVADAHCGATMGITWFTRSERYPIWRRAFAGAAILAGFCSLDALVIWDCRS